MDIRTAKALKVISFIFSNVAMFITVIAFMFLNIFNTINGFDESSLGVISFILRILIILALAIPSIFSLFGEIISLITIFIGRQDLNSAKKRK